MSDLSLSPSTHWYHSGWKVFLVGFAALAVVFILGFGGLIFYYWQEIKAGRGAILSQQMYGNFSPSTNDAGTALVRRADLETSDDPFLGNPDATIVVVEFVDFKCPNCKSALPIMKKVISQYGQKIKWIVRDFPAESLHAGASKMAELAACAQAQGLYWPTHDWLYENQENLPTDITVENLRTLANAIGLDYVKLSDCFNVGSALTEVNRDYADGLKLGVSGTPTFFVNGERAQGVVPWEVWQNFFSKLN